LTPAPKSVSFAPLADQRSDPFVEAPAAPASTRRERTEDMRPIRRVRLITLAVLLVMHVGTPVAPAQSAGKIRFGVGPLQPTPAETKKAYEPFFAYVARKLDRDFDLVATTDCTRCTAWPRRASRWWPACTRSISP